MSLDAANRVAQALLYEGYLLYPYYPSATKNRQRWTFGGVYPKSYVMQNPGADRSEVQAECLFECEPGAQVSIFLKFLHLIERIDLSAGAEQDRSAPGGFDLWEEACEREVILSELAVAKLCERPVHRAFRFETSARADDRFRRLQHPLSGELEISIVRIGTSAYRLRVRVWNSDVADYPERRRALLHSMVSTHVVMKLEKGRFFSSIDPPEAFCDIATQCRNEGLWPVLIGAPGDRSVMLASPIILYDHPQIAPESAGDLFDAAEIDEILSLRVLTLTDEEKALIRASDEKGRALLDRTESLTPDDLIRMHGRLRELRPQLARIGDREIRPGDRVRLKPKVSGTSRRKDVFDVTLAGMIAQVESIEQTLEGEVHLSVTLEDDPGRDLGAGGIPGHRFFFAADEVEVL